MIIRAADFDRDAIHILDGARDFVARMDFTAFLPDTDEKFVEAVSRVMTHPGMEVTVAEHEERIVGGLGMLWGTSLWNPDCVAADELFWWTAKDAPQTTALRLIRHVVRQAQERGALVSFKTLTSSPPAVDKVYAALGMRPVETAWIGNASWQH